MSSSVVSRRRSPLKLAPVGGISISVIALLASIGAPAPVAAQQSRPRVHVALTPGVVKPQTKPQGPYIAVVSIGSQRITLYNRDGVVATAPISSGRPGYDTPQGVFSIIERKVEHFSNLYDDAPMPFMQRITWSGVAMHAGALPGYPASHGCIRLPHSFAERLFGITHLNTRVVVVARDTEPLTIEHPSLLQPSLPEFAAEAQKTVPDAPRRPVPPIASEEAPMMLGVKPPKAEVPVAAGPDALKPKRAVTTLAEIARLKREAAVAKAAKAVKDLEVAKASIRPLSIEAQKAERAARAAEAAARRAESRIKWFERKLQVARTEEAIAKAKAAQAKFEAELAALRTSAGEQRLVALVRTAQAKNAVEAMKSADVAHKAAQDEVRIAARLTEPISAFVSRKLGRLYVRQGFQPVFDMPITIKDAERPIGTHVFTAIEDGKEPGKVRWTVVTVESGLPAAPAPRPSRRRGEPVPPPPPATTEHGSAALDRIEFPKEAIERISPYLQVGSSLIVSDLGLSIETGRGTDFVVLTRGEEQARASIAKYIAERRAAARRDRERPRYRSRDFDDD